MRNNDLKFSIIIPVCNTESDYLKKSISSCLSQTYHNFEVIIVDDGSKSVCAKNCDRYACDDSRIRVIHQKNAGVSSARNHGIKSAAGDWIICLDSDDWMEKNALKTLYEMIHAHEGVDVVLYSVNRVYANGITPLKPMYENEMEFSDEEVRHLQEDVLAYPLQNNTLVFPYCKAIRIDICRAMMPVFSEGLPMCEDVISAFELFDYSKKVLYISSALYNYRQANESAVYRYRQDADKEQMLFLSILRNIIENEKDPERYSKGFDREVFYASQRVITQKYFHKDSGNNWFAAWKACNIILKNEPYKTSIRQVESNGLSFSHKLKLFLIRNRMYGTCALLRRMYFLLPCKGV